MNPSDTVLVIPCYRDGARLAGGLAGLCAALVDGDGTVRVQVVDDGSPPEDQRVLATVIDGLRRRHAFLQPLLASPVNRGKGHAIRTGWDSAPQAAWLAFVDADGAVPATEVAALVRRAQQSSQPALFTGDRCAPGGRTVHRFWYRRIGSRLFNAWVRRLLELDLPDTQCGLKVVPASLYRSDPWSEDGFAFDLELLLRARAIGLPVVRQPISWQEKPGSTLGPGAMWGLFAAAHRLSRIQGRQGGGH